jgi:hypothetical protein
MIIILTIIIIITRFQSEDQVCSLWSPINLKMAVAWGYTHPPREKKLEAHAHWPGQSLALAVPVGA